MESSKERLLKTRTDNAHDESLTLPSADVIACAKINIGPRFTLNRRRTMMRYLASMFCSVLLVAGWSATEANAQAADAQTHVAEAMAAAYEPGQDFSGSPFDLCAEPAPATARTPPAPAAPAAPRTIPPRSEWYTDPVKVFDNLYYVGGSRDDNFNVWAVTTSEGIPLKSGAHF